MPTITEPTIGMRVTVDRPNLHREGTIVDQRARQDIAGVTADGVTWADGPTQWLVRWNSDGEDWLTASTLTQACWKLSVE